MRCSYSLHDYAAVILIQIANVGGKKDAVSGKDAKEKVRPEYYSLRRPAYGIMSICHAVSCDYAMPQYILALLSPVSHVNFTLKEHSHG